MNISYDMLARQEETGRIFGLILSGSPGIGKTHAAMAMVKPGDPFARLAVAGKNKDDFTTYPVPEKIDGIWVISQPITESVMIPLLKKNIGDGYGMLLLDDVTAADPSVQNAILELLQFGRIGEHELGKNVVIALTGNGIEDGAYAVPWSTAILGRAHFINYVANFNLWKDLPSNKNVDPIIMGYLMENTDFFAPSRGDSKADKYFDDNECGPSPRMWTTLGNSVTAKWGGIKSFQPNILFPDFFTYSKSLVGEKAAVALQTFSKIMVDYPTAEEMMTTPEKWNNLSPEKQNQMGAVFAVAHAVRMYTVKKNEQINADCDGKMGGKKVEAQKTELIKSFCYATATLMKKNREMGAFCCRYLMQKTDPKDPIRGVLADFAFGINNADPVLQDANFGKVLDDIRMMGKAIEPGK